MHLKKIVVAEDDDAIAHMVNMALGDAGYLCLRARDGREALSLVRTHTPDLLVLDVMMPRMDGIEVTKALRKDVLLSKTPIMMLTALSDVDNKVKGFDAGADDYVTKPFDLRELSARVSALIRSARRERERSPTTDLPGSTAIENAIDTLISEGGGGASVLHVDVRGFDSYADQVGFAAAQQLAKKLGEQLLNRIREFGGSRGFVGHLGGVDFIAIAESDGAEKVAAALVEDFEARRDSWIDKSFAGDSKDGAMTSAGGDLALTIAVVAARTGTHGQHGEELKRQLGAAMRSAKQAKVSGYVISQS